MLKEELPGTNILGRKRLQPMPQVGPFESDYPEELHEAGPHVSIVRSPVGGSRALVQSGRLGRSDPAVAAAGPPLLALPPVRRVLLLGPSAVVVDHVRRRHRRGRGPIRLQLLPLLSWLACMALLLETSRGCFGRAQRHSCASRSRWAVSRVLRCPHHTQHATDWRRGQVGRTRGQYTSKCGPGVPSLARGSEKLALSVTASESLIEQNQGPQAGDPNDADRSALPRAQTTRLRITRE